MVQLISQQVTELGWRFNPGELRNEHGEWTRTGEVLREPGRNYVQPEHARLVSPRGRPSDPAQHPFFQAHPVSPENIMASYDRTPAGVRAQGMRWYADAHIVAKALAHGDADKGAGVLAAYSPQTGWPVNMMNAARSFELGRAIGPGEGMVTKAMQDNAQEALDGKAADTANHSPKTRAFARLIRNGGDMPDDPLGDVVVDRHAMTVAMGKRLPKKEADTAPIGNDRYYQHVADQYREAARRISERDGVPVAPHQLQAITWLQQQEENEAADAAVAGSRERGRATMMRNAWEQWDAEAKAEEIPTYPGTTMLDATPILISQQVIELDWQHEPRDSHGRWTRFGGVGKAVSVMEKEREGFSVSPRTGESPTGGYMVALDGHTHRYPAEILDDPKKLTRAIDDMLMQERESFQGKDMFLGGWVEDGKLWLDPSQNVQDRAEAERLGRERDQVGIFDLNTFNTINTGGSGGGRIIDHANPGEGARGGPGQLLGHAGGRAPGRGGEDQQRYQGGIAAQVIEFAGWHDAWRHELRGRHGEWVRDGNGAASRYRELLGRPNRTSEQEAGDAAAAQRLLQQGAKFVPDLYGKGNTLNWDGKPPGLYPSGTRPEVLAEIDWNGHVEMSDKVARDIHDAMAPGQTSLSADQADSLTVALHEETHAVVPGKAGPSQWYADSEAYKDPVNQAIEEGFTQLGTAQHAEQFFRAIGVADRPTPLTDDNGGHLTAGQVAARLADPSAIERGQSWQHYAAWTRDAYNFADQVSALSQGTGKADPAEVRRIADIVNSVGTADKMHVMAELTMVAAGLDRVTPPLSAAERATALNEMEDTIRQTWRAGTPQQTVAQATHAFRSRVQSMRMQERAAA